jgi:hypothetical protein
LPPTDPEHLLEQAESLAVRTPARQADLRRAISTSYYAVFHFILTSAADLVVGPAKQSTPQYSLVYRSVDHSRLRQLCKDLTAKQLPPALIPFGTLGTIADFARIAINLHELRIIADYDPQRDFTPDEVRLEISNARRGIEWFKQGPKEQQETFLLLLLFKPR